MIPVCRERFKLFRPYPCQPFELAGLLVGPVDDAGGRGQIVDHAMTLRVLALVTAKVAVVLHPRVEMLCGGQPVGFLLVARGMRKYKVVAEIDRVP